MKQFIQAALYGLFVGIAKSDFKNIISALIIDELSDICFNESVHYGEVEMKAEKITEYLMKGEKK